MLHFCLLQHEDRLASYKGSPSFVPSALNFLSLLFIDSWLTPAYAEEAAGTSANTTFSYVIVAAVALATFIALATVRSSLSSSPWSLSDALSEEADITPLDKDGKPIPGADGKPQTISELRASSSRFIALIGLIGILMIYLGFGFVILQGFANNGSLPSDAQIKVITWLLFAGATMFAPYIVNKFSSVFDWLKPSKP